MNLGFFAKQLSNLRRRVGTLSLILVFALMLGAVVKAQVINLPVGVPVGTSGAGNARTDEDNFFIRNNVAGMTDIPFRNQNGQQAPSDKGRWRFNGSLQLSTYLVSPREIPARADAGDHFGNTFWPAPQSGRVKLPTRAAIGNLRSASAHTPSSVSRASSKTRRR